MEAIPNSAAQTTFLEAVRDLGKKLSRRQDKDELIQKNILKDDDSISPTLLQAKLSLEKEKEKAQLDKRLSHRPSKVDLKLRNILKVEDGGSNENLAQSGHELEKSLNFEQKAEALKSCLKKRPEKATLETANIIKGADIDPSIVAAQERLKRAQIEDTLEGKLRDRPDVEELMEKKVLLFSETVEVLPTFRKSEYNRKPPTDATFRKLTPQMKIAIREELNTYKKLEMPVHEQSLRNTCFH
ncbi:uncharacterized protein BJ171DRAFT_562111 [Polychytrium aggregatum]|uniref:uncharacterized protein n=1 Tax=Polychytrium aggregatum TaxID=110093 RepID=UPI0022FE1FCD|nr:uncharacterized protein BJ171DRAFT_562111 [Polychytrium aggregatum]KAI9203930.1 hypothetical protein BJ171DRAFT_562111 [Polychytrium aggregatum]